MADEKTQEYTTLQQPRGEGNRKRYPLRERREPKIFRAGLVRVSNTDGEPSMKQEMSPGEADTSQKAIEEELTALDVDGSGLVRNPNL